MSSVSRRRNGSKASCEPCRKCKVRCDHQKPTCDSCRRRGLSAKCWYHPAPLTKPRQNAAQCSSSPIETQAARPRDSINGRSSLEPGPQACRSEPTPRFHTWPYVAQDVANSTSQHVLDSTSAEKFMQECLPVVKQIMSPLRYFEDIKRGLDYYFTSSQVLLVPGPLIRQLVATIHTCPISAPYIKGDLEQDSQSVSRDVDQVLRNASRDIIIEASLDLAGFCALFCGQNLRVELLGLLYTIAARAIYMSDNKATMEHGLVRQLVQGSNLALRLARDFAAQPNDLLIWLAYENFQLTVLVEGDASRCIASSLQLEFEAHN